MRPEDDEDYTELEGVTPPCPSQAKLDTLEGVESDEDEDDSNPATPPASDYFEIPLNLVDDDGRQELLQEQYFERAARYSRFLSSERWAQMRNAVFMRDGGRCHRCNQTATEVHHERYIEPLEDQDLDDLRALCGPCHRQRHQEMFAYEPTDPLRIAAEIGRHLQRDEGSDDD